MNFKRMTIRALGNQFQVFNMKPVQDGGYSTDMAGKRFSWIVSAAASSKFTGNYVECVNFISSQSAEYMSEHGISC